MGHPLVSIVVPTYNVERYVEDCIDSLLNQTYKNKEIIVLDDASTDATVYLLKQYGNQIQLIQNKTNKGQGARRNEGLKQAEGNYIYFVDSDDWIEPDTIDKLVKQAEETDADLVRFNGTVFYEGDMTLLDKGNYDFSHVLENKATYSGEDILVKNRHSFSASPCLYLIKKDVIEENTLTFLEGVLHEDEYFTTRLFISIRSMTYLNEAFYHRRFRIASTMTENTNKHKLKSFDSYLEVFKSLEQEYRSANLTESQQAFIKRQLLSIYNGLRESQVPLEYKKKLRDLKSITFKDKMFIEIAKLKHRMNK